MKNEAVILSPPDARDYPVCMAMDVAEVDIPASFEVWQPPVENQGATGNCVAQSLANIMECIDHRDGLLHKDRSVGYIYGTQKGVGMMVRDACEAVVKDGDVYRSVFEYLDENPGCYLARQQVSQGVRDLAKRGAMYVRINTKEEMQLFMLRYGLPVLIVGKSEAFTSWQFGGLHAVAARGWISREDWKKSNLAGFEYKDIHYTNSWGVGGNRGDGTGYIKFEEILEAWGIVPMEEAKFTDVAEGRWSEKAIYEAAQDGVLKGYPDNTFRPDKPLTREEAAAVWLRIKALMQSSR